jgi:aquaporin Z
VYALGPLSGAHCNPAVTFAHVLTGKMRSSDVLGYVIAQIAGAIAASALVLLIMKGNPNWYDPRLRGMGANGFGLHSPAGFNLGSGFAIEVALTFIFVLTVLGATDIAAPVGFAGLAIGLALTLVHLIGLPITSVSVNPARSIGPALFVRGWAIKQLWLFLVAPLLGAALAAGVHRLLHGGLTGLSARRAERALPLQQAERAGA